MRLRFPLLSPLLSTSRQATTLRSAGRSASAGLTTDPSYPRGSEAPAYRQVIDPRGNSVRCLQRHREGKESYRRSARGKRRTRWPTSPARPGRLPPAAAPSAGSRPPPPPPSSAAAAAGKGAEETASLPLPTTHAQHGPTVQTGATSVRREVRAPGVTGAQRGGATEARRAYRRGPPRTHVLGFRPECIFRYSSVFSSLRCSLPQYPTRTTGAKTLGSCTGWGPRVARSRDQRFPRAASRSFLRPRCPPDPHPPRVPSTPPQPSCPPALPRNPLAAVFTFPPTRPRLPLFLAPCAFPERHVGDHCFLWNLPASECGVFTSLGFL